MYKRQDLAEVADYVYENVFLHYTMKQWGQTPDEIDPSVTARVPVFVGDDDRYFPQAPFQGMPAEGYTALFENMLDHDCIDVFCGVDARDIFELDETTVKVRGNVYGGEVIYTGPLDELFNLDLGALPYQMCIRDRIWSSRNRSRATRAAWSFSRASAVVWQRPSKRSPSCCKMSTVPISLSRVSPRMTPTASTSKSHPLNP